MCVHKSENGHACYSPAHDRYEYCLRHLEYLTDNNVKPIVFQIFVDELGVDLEELTPGAHFKDDLGADSLDIPELVMRLEEVFGIDIPSEIPKEMLTVGGAVKWVTDKLLSEEKYLLDPAPKLEEVDQKVSSSEGTADRRLKQILETPLFQDYFAKTKLEGERVKNLFQIITKNNRIYHVTTVPEFVGERLAYVYIFLLGRSRIYLFKLQHKSITFQSASLSELRLSYEILFGDDHEISEVIVSSRSPQHIQTTDDESAGDENIYNSSFEFKDSEGIEGALAFLSKYLEHVKER